MSFWSNLKSVLSDPKVIQALGIAAHVAVAIAVKNPQSLARANEILGAADQITGFKQN